MHKVYLVIFLVERGFNFLSLKFPYNLQISFFEMFEPKAINILDIGSFLGFLNF